MGKTLYEKIWDNHIVNKGNLTQPDTIYIDLHLIHEVTSPQAFEGLRLNGRRVRRTDRTFATMDHAIPTLNRNLPFEDPIAQKQVNALRENCNEFDIKLFDLISKNQGIVHIIAPELGMTLPGQTIVCGDSHTSTHGAFGTIAFGIGTSEVEHVFATQTLKQFKSKTLAINLTGNLPLGATAKDIILSVIGKYGHDFASGYAIEYRGKVIRQLSIEERMTICNMSIEMGAKVGLVAPDETTFSYLKNKPNAPKGKKWGIALKEWEKLYTDKNAKFDLSIDFDCGDISPQITWGTNPGQVVSVNESVPNIESFPKSKQLAVQNALKYMDLKPGTRMKDIKIDTVFIGSCTNSRLEDLREAVKIVDGYEVADNIRALIVPGSQLVKETAEKEGLDKIFTKAGFEWRDSGCSMCLGMNTDVAKPGERIASTSNRNFEGRQGEGARTHLVSPPMAAAAAIKGHFVDVRRWENKEGDIK